MIKVNKQNEGTFKELIDIGLIKSYDLLGAKGREAHDNRIAKCRVDRQFIHEKRLSFQIPYII